MKITQHHDPMGQAISDYFEGRARHPLVVSSPQFDDDELPVGTLFRPLAAMSPLEQRALGLCRGGVLDVGAGAGCHSLELQARGLDVTAVDISPLAVQTMRRRGLKRALVADVMSDDVGGPYDTVLLMMNGLGLAGNLEGLPRLLTRCAQLLATGGCVLADSSDLVYLFEDEDGEPVDLPTDRYYGEVDYRMSYGKVQGERFGWLYVDLSTLEGCARACGLTAECVARGAHHDYLARIAPQRD